MRILKGLLSQRTASYHSVKATDRAKLACKAVFTAQRLKQTNLREFKYLGHIVSYSQLDDSDIHRERKNLFYRCSMLTRRFSNCSAAVKLQLFKTFC